VFSLAIVRSSGALSEKSAGVPSAAEWTPNANLEWAAQAIREIDAKRPNDPTVQADLGEALSKLPHARPEALKILQSLAQKDLMGSPFAYAALAGLRSDTGDLAGAEAAIKRCEEMSKSPGVCKPAAPSKPSVPTVVAAKA
jgi:predicted Zn-dependent protease